MTAMRSAVNNYSRWPVEIFRWSSAEQFARKSTWQNGIHSIELSGGPNLDLYVAGSPLESKLARLPVFFNGAVQDREDKQGPFFSGIGLAESGDIPCIAIADPTLGLSTDVGLAWYAGNEFQDVPTAIELVLSALHSCSGKELLLIGGSGGGFAALRYGNLLGSKASVLAWNPQTDILEYNETFVRAYLETAFGALLGDLLAQPDWKKRVRTRLSEQGYEVSLFTDNSAHLRAHRSIVIQNATDWHVPVHTSPLISTFGYKHFGQGMYLDRSEHGVFITQYGNEHQPLPGRAVHYLTERMLTFEETPRQTISALRTSDTVETQNIGLEPKNMLGLREQIAETLDLHVIVHESSIEIRVDLGSIPLGYGGLNFGYFLETDTGHPISHQWYIRSPSTTLSTDENLTGLKVKVHVRDGFHNRLTSLDHSIETKMVGNRQRVFIYGSCVSRDAFELDSSLCLIDYIARSPFGSAFGPKLFNSNIDFSLIQSKFQRRMVETDFSKNLEVLLTEISYDILLVDLIDERLPIVKYNGSVVTASSESKVLDVLSPDLEIIIPGSSEHFRLWKMGLSKLIHVCDPRRIVVNKVFWSVIDSDGEDLPNRSYIDDNNKILEELYNELGRVPGVRFISYPRDLLRGDVDHKWGVAPFHFTREANVHLLTELEATTHDHETSQK